MADAIRLKETADQGWLAGFGSVFRVESAKWWRTRRWWVQSLLWLVIINGLVMVDNFWSAPSREAILEEGIKTFLVWALVFPALGIVVLMQSLIIGEKQSGTAAWILSKPVARSAFLLGKAAATAIPALVIMVALQGAIGYLQIASAAGGFFPLLPFLIRLVMAGLHLLFYLALTLLLGTLYERRGPVIGIPLAVLIAQPLLGDFIPTGLAKILPGSFMAAASGGAPPGLISFAAVVAWTLVFTLTAIWRFNREEL